MKRVCVYLGSNPGNRPEYATVTRGLARELAARGLGLVYGGSSTGLMGRLADTCLEAGGEVIGVIPELLKEKEIAHTGLTESHVVSSMHERKQKMADLSDAFIALPGGLGTLDEFFEALTWNQLGYHAKPCGLLDVNGYYACLADHMDRMVDEGFLLPDHRRMVMTSPDPANLLDMFKKYDPPPRGQMDRKEKGPLTGPFSCGGENGLDHYPIDIVTQSPARENALPILTFFTPQHKDTLRAADKVHRQS